MGKIGQNPIVMYYTHPFLTKINSRKKCVLYSPGYGTQAEILYMLQLRSSSGRFFFLHFYSSFQTHDLKTDKTSDPALLNPKIQNNLTAFFIEKLNLKSPNHSMEPVPKSLYVTCACIITAFGT